MPDIVSERAITFSRRVRETATVLEQAFWLSKRLSREWIAMGMATSIPNTADNIIDNQYPNKPLTGADITNIITRCDALITDYEQSSAAKLNVVVKASNLPLE